MSQSAVLMSSETEIIEDIKKRADWEKLLFFIGPVISVILMYIVQIPYHYIRWSNLGYFAAKFFISCVFFCGVQYFFAALSNNRLIGFLITNTGFLLLSVASSVMMTAKSVPLIPFDFVMASQLTKVTQFVNLPIKAGLICGLIMWIGYMYLYTYVYRHMKKKSEFSLARFSVNFVVALLFVSLNIHLFCYNNYFKRIILPKIGVTISEFDTAGDYMSNGFILTFFPRIGNLRIEVPEGYSEESVEEIAATSSNEDVLPISGTTAVNVIAIQSEAWWDPARFENVTMSEDPLKNIRALEAGGNAYFGKMLSPAFGGGTCIPEFEFLTGLSTKLLPEGSYPYSQYVRHQIYSLAQIFKDNGFETSAIHTYDKKFYNRNVAYPLLGFDEFLGHTDLKGTVKKGTYISDMYLSEQIIKRFEEADGNPLFVYAVSMQNHGNYLDPRYESYDVEVNSDVLSEDELSGLREAVQGVYDIDKSFMALVDHFKNVSQPTLIVMYGDHLPFLGIDSSTFRKVGFMDGGLEKNSHMYETPYIIWANYDISEFAVKERVGPQYLGISTVKMAGVKELPWHFAFLDDFYKKHTAYQHTFVLDENGEYTDMSAVSAEDKSAYEIVQYDCLFGGTAPSAEEQESEEEQE